MAGSQDQLAGAWLVARLQQPFDTELISFRPWGDPAPLCQASAVRKSPREIVREISGNRLAPSDIRVWLLRTQPSLELWKEDRFQAFGGLAKAYLLRSLASEISDPTTAVFFGPPRRTVPIDHDLASAGWHLGAFASLQAAAKWVYEEPRTTEQRHALLGSELTRSIAPGSDGAAAFQASGNDILQGARLAFALGQSDLTKEALKTQSDLRKSVADDTTKATEGARSVATGLATAIGTAIALFVARGSSATSSTVVAAIACAVSVYLFVVGVSSLRHLAIQEGLRLEWRKRFYRFLPDDDYRHMVARPIEQAELIYRVIAWLCIYASMGLIAFSADILLQGYLVRP